METKYNNLSGKKVSDSLNNGEKGDKSILEPIEIDGKYGFSDESGEVVIPCQWRYT